jgi:hypothetical protein
MLKKCFWACTGINWLTCIAAQPLPVWAGPDLDPLLPLGGVPLAPNGTLINIFRASSEFGTFNTLPRIDEHNFQMITYWQNKLLTNVNNPDAAVYAIYYSQSMDGETWTPTDGTNILFPSLTRANSSTATALLVPAPSLHINGSSYVACSVTVLFSLYPDPFQTEGLLLLRKVITPGLGQFGPLFWAWNVIPEGFEDSSMQAGIVALIDMDTQTQQDINTLFNWSVVPCGTPGKTVTKCEACINGCLQGYHLPELVNVSGLPSIYQVPNGGPDMILYSSKNGPMAISVSTRATPADAWSIPVVTTIPDANTVRDAGVLSDGRVFIVANSMPNIMFDPLFISTSVDGYKFNRTTVLTSCSLPAFIAPDQPTGCLSRFNLFDTELGAHSPDAFMVTAGRLEGLWVAFSLNTEDIWMLRLPVTSV